MNRLAFSAVLTVLVFPLLARAQESQETGPPAVLVPEDFGAVADDGEDDRAAIQAALQAAASAGGGTVKLGPGQYDVTVVVARGYGGTSGYHGVAVPPNCTLIGSGPDLTSLIIHRGSAAAASIGNGVINAGYETALRDYGAGGNIRIADFRIDTPDTDTMPTGNLVGLAHVDGAVISNLVIGSSRAHGLEINLSRNVDVEDCVFDGRHFGSSTLQLDMGLIGAKSLIPTTTVIQDVRVKRCKFKGRSEDNTSSTKVIELGHTSSDCIVRNISFEDTSFEALPLWTSVCVTADNPPAKEISGLRFERCEFIGMQAQPSPNGMLQLALQGNQLLQDVVVRDCLFRGLYYRGLVIISDSMGQYGSWANRRRFLIEGNTFAPTLDRETPYTSGGRVILLTVGACSEVTVRRNHFEVPATAENLTMGSGVTSCQLSNNLDVTVEDNVFTWAHTTAAGAPFGASRLNGLWMPVTLLEKNGIASRQRITGNIFLAPPGGINYAMRMPTDVPTTAWAPGGPWTGGVVAGNYACSPGAAGSPWQLHWDLSEGGGIGTIAETTPERLKTKGWYAANGAPLTTLDISNNALARVNAQKCGYSDTLPSQSGKVVRLHGPLGGEGLLLDWMSRYAGSVYRGDIFGTPGDLRAQPFDQRLQGELCVVRRPLTVFRWEGAVTPDSLPPGALEPLDKLPDTPGCWVPLNTGLSQLDDNADADGDGLTNAEEKAFLKDPLTPDNDDVLSLCKGVAESEYQVRFRCASGPHGPKVCLLSSDDLTNWRVESSCQKGTAFEPPAAGTLTELPASTGREVSVTTAGADRRFWKLVFEP